MVKNMSTTIRKQDAQNLGLTSYQAGVLQASAHRSLQKFCDEILRPYGITKMHWIITGTVLDAGERGITLTDLAQKLTTTLPYLTNTINLLVSKGVLERKSDQADERTKRIVVAPQFQEKCDEIERAIRARLRSTIYADITPEEFQTYLHVLYKLGAMQ